MKNSNNNNKNRNNGGSRLRLTTAANKSKRKMAGDATTKMTSSASSSSVTSNQKTMTKGRAATSRGNLLVPEILAKVAVPVYLFTITTTWVLGVAEVAPFVYRHHPPSMLLFQRGVMTFLYLQMTLNWLCIRYVDSSYSALLKARWLEKQQQQEKKTKKTKTKEKETKKKKEKEEEEEVVEEEEVEEEEERGEGGRFSPQKMGWKDIICAKVVMWLGLDPYAQNGGQSLRKKEKEKEEGGRGAEEEVKVKEERRSGSFRTRLDSQEEEVAERGEDVDVDVKNVGAVSPSHVDHSDVLKDRSQAQNPDETHAKGTLLRSEEKSVVVVDDDGGSGGDDNIVSCSKNETHDDPSRKTSLADLETLKNETSRGKPPTRNHAEELTSKNKSPWKQGQEKDKEESSRDVVVITNTTTTHASSSKCPWKPEFRPPNQTTFSYWSWAPCYICQVMRPPRCHHCSECNTCVLKRDHHCYFAGNCVGFKNQRHFLVFGAWAFFSCCYATSHAMPYLFNHMWQDMRWWDLLAPVTVTRAVFGYVSPLVALNICVQTFLFYFLLLSLNFVVEHVDLIARGLTSFELRGLKKNVQVKDSRDVSGRFRSVLGRHWAWNLLCPLHWLWEAEEDPENWPSIAFIRY